MPPIDDSAIDVHLPLDPILLKIKDKYENLNPAPSVDQDFNACSNPDKAVRAATISGAYRLVTLMDSSHFVKVIVELDKAISQRAG